jgi:hypothetical protein
MTPEQRDVILGHISRAERNLCNAGVSAQATDSVSMRTEIVRWLDAAESEIAAVRQALDAGIASHHSATTPGPDHITVQGEPSDV